MLETLSVFQWSILAIDKWYTMLSEPILLSVSSEIVASVTMRLCHSKYRMSLKNYDKGNFFWKPGISSLGKCAYLCKR